MGFLPLDLDIPRDEGYNDDDELKGNEEVMMTVPGMRFAGPVYPIDLRVLRRLIRESGVPSRAEFAALIEICQTQLSHLFRGVRRHLRRDTIAQIYYNLRQHGLDPSGLSVEYEQEEKGGENGLAGLNWEDLPLVLTVPEVAKVLRTSPGLVYQLIREGQIHALRSRKGRGATIRISKDELKRYLAGGERISIA